MINVDISNVWGQLSLPDLLAMEKDIADAHAALAEGADRGWMDLPVREDPETHSRLRKTAARIRMESDVCVVVGDAGLGVRAVVELLQGPDRNTGREKGDPMLVFAGTSLSTRHWNALTELLKGRDVSLIALPGAADGLETAVAFRGLRWVLDRKYGTDEAKKRIYAVTASREEPLFRMAEEGGWERFAVPAGVEAGSVLLSPAGLLPMAVAGLDIPEILRGAAEARETYDLRSYDNPVWLYTAVRKVLGRAGKRTELLGSFEPGFRAFGSWWQRLLATAGTEDPLVVPQALPAGLYSLEDLVLQSAGNLFETLIRFDPPEVKHTIGVDWKDPEGLSYLEGMTLDQVEEQAFQTAAQVHGDAGVSVLTVDCGGLDEAKAGELIFFLQLVWGISRRVQGAAGPGGGEYSRTLLRLLGKPETEE